MSGIDLVRISFKQLQKQGILEISIKEALSVVDQTDLISRDLVNKDLADYIRSRSDQDAIQDKEG